MGSDISNSISGMGGGGKGRSEIGGEGLLALAR
jgi:hypothetical protein